MRKKKREKWSWKKNVGTGELVKINLDFISQLEGVKYVPRAYLEEILGAYLDGYT